MALAPGAQLGPYEILEPLGAGGMGEVYRARDSRLARDVALKILPDDFAADSDRRARFDREARAAGQIQHPNILAILDTGAHDNLPFIVTELLEGETLRERLRPGPLPQRKAIEIASQVARGLGAAHEKGVVHRDIKPENIFISSDGHVKILDFGLARLSAQEPAPPDATLTLKTASGIVLGTAAYMSPEQVRGLAADSRSDIFSLGSVLYEMISGRRPFPGSTYADLISAILHQDPAPLPPGSKILPALDRIIRRCLEKSPAERFQSARDLAFQLDSLVSSIESSGSGELSTPRAEFRAAHTNFSMDRGGRVDPGNGCIRLVVPRMATPKRPPSSGDVRTPYRFFGHGGKSYDFAGRQIGRVCERFHGLAANLDSPARRRCALPAHS